MSELSIIYRGLVAAVTLFLILVVVRAVLDGPLSATYSVPLSMIATVALLSGGWLLIKKIK